MYLPPPPPSQGLDSKTFTPPPLDGSTNIPELVKFHARYSGDHALFVYRGSAGEDVQITWSAFADAVERCAGPVVKATGLVPSAEGSPPTVAIFANTDTVTYAVLLFGILRAGLVPFLISPRNSAPAVLHLLEGSDAHHVFVSADHTVQRIVEAATEGTEYAVFRHDIMEEVRLSFLDRTYTRDSGFPNLLAGENAVIMHSSGSTGFPKTTRLTQMILLQYARIPYYGDVDFCGHIVSIHAVPIFHMQGVAFLLRAIATGFVLAVFSPQAQYTVPSPARVLGGVKDDRCTMLACVPSFLEAWSSDEGAIGVLRNLKAVIFSGAPLSQKAGDKLAASGVNLHMYYAGTEVGCVSKFIPRTTSARDWQYISFSPHFEAHFVPLDSRAEMPVFELVTVETPAYTPGTVNTSIGGRNAFATGDLFVRHPADAALWRVYGRADDVIMLSSGEKTIPGPIEAVFLEEARIGGAVMFGRGRPHNGIILELSGLGPDEREAFSSASDGILRQLMDRANAAAPAHSRLYTEMVLLARPSEPFPRTTKGNVQRAAVLGLYETEIERAYEEFGLAAGVGELPLPRGPDSELDYRLLVNTIVTEVLGEPVEELSDVFQQGCDSVQATRIRNMLVVALGRAQPGIDGDSTRIPVDVVYRYPRPGELAEFVRRVVSGDGEGAGLGVKVGGDWWEERAALMNAMVARFTAGMRPPVDAVTVPEGEGEGDVVLLTGTTGALGSYLLADLARRPGVRRIYAVNRPHPRARDPRSLLERQKDSFTARFLDPAILESEKVVFVEVDVSERGWGEAYKFLDGVTIIIHAAWPVDFNRGLSSFSDALEGLRNLIDFAASRPMRRLLFVSSTGLFRNQPSPYLTPEIIPEGPAPDPVVAAGLGYAESKWVAERVLEAAAARMGVVVAVVRIGQLCGGRGGAWNVAEWVPAVVQSALGLGYLPDCDRTVSWLPVDMAARSVCELVFVPWTQGGARSRISYFHLEHPRPVPWTAIFGPLVDLLGVKLVPFEEWLGRVRARAAGDTQSHLGTSGPGEEAGAGAPRVLRLLPFFEAKDRDGAYCMLNKPGVGVEKTVARLSPEFEDMKPLSAGDVRGWVEYWRSVGFLG